MVTEFSTPAPRRVRPAFTFCLCPADSPSSQWLGVWAALWEGLGCCPACATPAFPDEGCVMVAPGAKGSFPSSTDDATKPRKIIALSNPHTRTTGFKGIRMCMADLWDEERGYQYPAHSHHCCCHFTSSADVCESRFIVSGKFHRPAVDERETPQLTTC